MYWLLSFPIYSKNVMKSYMTFSSKGLVNMKKKHWQIIGSLFILSHDNYLLKCCSKIMYYMYLLYTNRTIYTLIYVHKQDYDDFIIIKFMMRKYIYVCHICVWILTWKKNHITCICIYEGDINFQCKDWVFR